jgi:hypothetical protein
MKINITPSNYAYFKVDQLKLRYEYSITLILQKT